MKLSKVDIRNFRSIKDATIHFDPSCRVLVGINESGKSNILKALALLDPEREALSSDIRFPLENEQSIQESFVRFEFILDEQEIKYAYENLLTGILRKDKEQELFFHMHGKQVALKDFIRLGRTVYFQIDLLNDEEHYGCYGLPTDGLEIECDDWKRLSEDVPEDYFVEVKEDEFPLLEYILVSVNDFPDIPDNYLADVTLNQVAKTIEAELVNVLKSEMPDCIYWSYSEKNLLPASIALTAFMKDPAICVPLRNMFELAGVTDIKAAVDIEMARHNGLRNLLARVAKHTTGHIRGIWKEYDSIEILLEPNGENIDASVRESFNRHDFASRSDGFKRFVSFLIMVSTKVRTNQLENTLLLIDEPEIALHPSGARYLRDELINISEKNSVVYSTHSVFMVDKENVERHLIVRKQNEVTELSDVTTSNFVDEEVIYNALGYSIFDGLKQCNILFEGWRDKKLFRVALENPPATSSTLRDEFQRLGIANLQGVKDVGRVSTILELANRNYIVVSDCDDAAKAEQKKFSGEGDWVRWDELSQEAEVVTGEDFLKNDYLIDLLAKAANRFPKLAALDMSLLNLSAGGGKLYCIQRWVGNALGGEEKKSFINYLKEESIRSLTSDKIEEYFYKYLHELVGRVQQMSKV